MKLSVSMFMFASTVVLSSLFVVFALSVGIKNDIESGKPLNTVVEMVDCGSGVTLSINKVNPELSLSPEDYKDILCERARDVLLERGEQSRTIVKLNKSGEEL